MKPASFDYVRADSLAQVLHELAQYGDEATILAGGQTLVPMMAMRLARPARLIDINEITPLAGIEDEGDMLRIRAMTRQAHALENPLVQQHLPLLAKALSFVGHGQTRNRGTIGGSIAHADPTAEIALTATALEASISLTSRVGTRSLPASTFFQGALSTARAAEECLTEIRFPIWREGRVGIGFHEVSPRHGDFAVVAAAAQLLFDEDGVCRRASLAIGGASPAPVRVRGASAFLIGARVDARLAAIAAGEVDDVIDPSDDIHATRAYRRRVARVLAERAIREAAGL